MDTEKLKLAFENCFLECTWGAAPAGTTGMCRECIELQEIVENWHMIAPTKKILGMVRNRYLSGHGLEAAGIDPIS